MKKKPFVVCLFLVLVSILLSVRVLAHPGKTDGDGGHTNHDTDEYHYHHGYPEHNHYDMDGDGDIDCPYDFVDKTGQNSGSSGGSSSGSGKTYESSTSVKKEDNGTDLRISLVLISLWHLGVGIGFILLCCFVLFPVFLFVWNGIRYVVELIFSKVREEILNRITLAIIVTILLVLFFTFLFVPIVNYLDANVNMLAAVLILVLVVIILGIFAIVRKVNQKESAIHLAKEKGYEIELLKEKLASQNREIQSFKASKTAAEEANTKLEATARMLYAKNDVLEAKLNKLQKLFDLQRPQIPGLPDDVYLVHGNVPAKGEVTEQRPFGDLTVYITNHGKNYHTRPYCGGRDSLHPVHAYDIIGKRIPCKMCGFSAPEEIPDWYLNWKSNAK